MIASRSQQVACKAYAAVKSFQDHPDGVKAKDYLSFARAFPTLIHTCGLAQATAFALAKQGAQARILTDLATVLGIEPNGHPTAGAELQRLARGEDRKPQDLRDYMRLTRRALFAASWLKRYAEALLADKEGT